MQLFALGLNHQSASLALRERVAFAQDALSPALYELREHSGMREAVIVSTCNRTDIYCGREAGDSQDIAQVLDWLRRRTGFSDEILNDNFYKFADANAVKHAFRVAAGLDSMVVGEPQILGQMKHAFWLAATAGATGKVLNQLFQRTFSVAKQVRTDTAVGSGAVSVAFAGVSLAKRIFTRLDEQSALLVGAGETVELIARHLVAAGVKKIIIANRSLDKATILARTFSADNGNESDDNKLSATAIPLSELQNYLPQVDIVATATASTLPILGKGAIEAALTARKHKPIFILDLGVPRDVESAVGELRDAYLYSIDDLQSVVAESRNLRADAAIQAETIIDLQVVRFMRWLRSLESVPTIRKLRTDLNEIGDMEAAVAARKIASGGDIHKITRELARRLVNKFAHNPSEVLRQADMDGDAKLASAARKLFALKDKK